MRSLATVMGPRAHQLRHRTPGRLDEDSDGVEVQRERRDEFFSKDVAQFVLDALIHAMQEQQMQLAVGTARLAAIPMGRGRLPCNFGTWASSVPQPFMRLSGP